MHCIHTVHGRYDDDVTTTLISEYAHLPYLGNVDAAADRPDVIAAWKYVPRPAVSGSKHRRQDGQCPYGGR
jgi:hypothetical protein